MKALELIKRALNDLGVLGAGETPSDEDAQDALDDINEWIDQLALEELTMYFEKRTLKTLAASTASYTIGTGGSIDIVRPVDIDYAKLIIDTGASLTTEIPLEVLSVQRWAGIPQKSLTSALVRAIFYDRNWSAGLGLVYVFPIPDVGTTQLVLYTPQALTEFADLATDYTFSPGYRRFLRTGTVRVLSSAYGKALTPEQVRAANKAEMLIKRANTMRTTKEAGVDAALLSPFTGAWDYRTGDFLR